MTGFIKVVCWNCDNEFKTEVNFPEFNKGFETKIEKCPHCGDEIRIFDAHEYNEDGTIKTA